MVFPTKSASSSEWVDFNTEGEDNGFEAIVMNSNQSSSERRPPSRSASGSKPVDSDSASVLTWMKQPVSTDKSIAPLAPPRSSRGKAASEHPVANKHRPPRSLESTITESSEISAQRSNPVSSSDESSSSGHRPSSRGRGVQRSSSATMPHTSTGRDESSGTGAKPQRHRGRSRTGHRSVERREAPVVESREEPAERREVPVERRAVSVERREVSVERRHVPVERRAVSVERRLVPVERREVSVESSEVPAVDPARERGRRRSTSRGKSAAAPSAGFTTAIQPPRPLTRSASLSRPPTTAIQPPRPLTRSASLSRPPTTPVRRARSTSRNPPVARITAETRARPAKPPCTSKTRRQHIINTSSSSSVGPGVVPIRQAGGSNRSVVSESSYMRDDNIGRDISFGRTASANEGTGRSRTPLLSSPMAASLSSSGVWNQPDRIHSRILLTATVYHNSATNLWIATLNTNQKGVAKNPAMASKYLKAFSFASENEARESAIANAPPKMLPFPDHPECQICHSKFTMFRRAGHCRNCGVCICANCSTQWPAKMVPDTYNLKKEANVRVCKSCNHLSASFKKALLDGNYEESVAVYGTGNINLRSPFPQFAKKKEETMHPIHCAVAGGNLEIVRWLVEDHFCPIKVVRSGSAKPKRGGSADELILTSNNRSVLTIAMEGLHVDIMRYLVVDHNVSIYGSKDLKTSQRALEAVLLALPAARSQRRYHAMEYRWDQDSFDDNSLASSNFCDMTIGGETRLSRVSRNGSTRRAPDEGVREI